mgnify:CR=1 FL=1
MSADAAAAYMERNDFLEDLGFKNYLVYLRGTLWKSIRHDKLAKDPECYGCGRGANQVHHGKYTLENLSGLSDEHLFSLCGRCHKWIEITKDWVKRSPTAATEELERVRARYFRRGRFKKDSRIRLTISSARNSTRRTAGSLPR